jgi:hypothetical protein
MAKSKRINVNAMFDEFVAGHDDGDEECRAMQTIRNLFRSANDAESKDSGPNARFLVDHMMGRPTQKVELATPQGIQIDASPAVLAMMGLKSLTGTFVNADGESEEMKVTPLPEALDG